MLIEMSAGELHYRFELTEVLLQRGGMFEIKRHLELFMRGVLTGLPNTVQDFRITLPHGTVKLTKGWHVTETECYRLTAQWVIWIQEDLK
jgi:hypothetical protein